MQAELKHCLRRSKEDWADWFCWKVIFGELSLIGAILQFSVNWNCPGNHCLNLSWVRFEVSLLNNLTEKRNCVNMKFALPSFNKLFSIRNRRTCITCDSCSWRDCEKIRLLSRHTKIKMVNEVQEDIIHQGLKHGRCELLWPAQWSRLVLQILMPD